MGLGGASTRGQVICENGQAPRGVLVPLRLPQLIRRGRAESSTHNIRKSLTLQGVERLLAEREPVMAEAVESPSRYKCSTEGASGDRGTRKMHWLRLPIESPNNFPSGMVTEYGRRVSSRQEGDVSNLGTKVSRRATSDRLTSSYS